MNDAAGDRVRMNTGHVQNRSRYAPDQETRFLYELWRQSYEAELTGEFTRALEIHRRILSRVGTSYAAYLRAGWLHYQAGGYSRSLHFYVKALLLSPGEKAPLCGIKNCHLAMGNKEAAARAANALRFIEDNDCEHAVAV